MSLCLLHLYILLKFSLCYANEEYSCENTICNPRAGDLLIGRESSLWASSTCGLNSVEAYCVVTTSGKSFCRECVSSQPYNAITNPESHRIENVVSRVPSNPGRWWQSENGIHNVSIVLNLDTQFQFISTILRFKTYRPAAMYLERSYDFGRSWKRYAYFSNNCKRDFPSVPEGTRRTLTEVTCTGVYSQLTPSEGGVVAYMAAPSEMHASWPQYSKERMNLTAITNLRAVFTRLNTLGDMRVDDSSLTRRKYYYALFEWNVWGRCTCFGHAVRCKPKSSAEIIKREKVYGVCECTHNTAGENCETCQDFYWNKPWRPATKDAANPCERCNCNNHATACFFNPLLFINSGNVSGGNCHGCMHNTEGVNCEFCLPNFYRHPNYPIDHPATCQPCNCHTDGTLYGGYCQQYTILEQNSVAGRCLCKKNVGGEKCDRCKVGFWNFQAENADGCQECTCNMMGTLDNGGCDPFTGLCTCKRFVGGANCDHCLEGYFNLTRAPLGCQECACSQLGSKNTVCNRMTGKCECKVGFTGRDCGQVEDGYYVYTPREMITDRETKTITVHGPKGGGQFIIVLDVDPKQFRESDKWTLIVEPYQQGASRCRNPSQSVVVHEHTSKIIISDVCLESGLPVILRILPQSATGEPYRQILITDVILVPTDDSELARRCEVFREIATEILAGTVLDRSRMPPECEEYFRLPRISWRDTTSVARPCNCNTTGSVNEICDKMTGQCACKPGVIGQACDGCAPYHYDFSAVGCTACGCNSQGSLNLQCDEATSNCPCRPGVVGRHCDMCEPGSWGFPNCRPCQCNNFADTCNQTTGVCEDCREYTGGVSCERCQEGFYGDPLRGTPCKPCACPGGGVNHAISCALSSLQEQICYCKVGYTGSRCSECAMNYYGNPTEPDGSCRVCQCSGNIAMHEPGSCDTVTGRCLKCLHYTEGYNCELCQQGYWGDATRQMCQACNCYATGTVDKGVDGCNRQTGQCDCLPNVVGARCYECAKGFFNLTSGTGCEPCQCDPTGSLDDTCKSVTGQCRCKPDRSGRKCDQCRRLFYGDPHQEGGCKPCGCDRRGATSDRCDPITGQCPCHVGIAGRRCDKCDRGTEGTLPYCKPCGECWDNWDATIDNVIAELNRLKNQVGRQLPSDLKLLFNSLVGLLEQIENLPWMQLNNSRIDSLEEIFNRTEQLVRQLSATHSTPGSLWTLLDELGEKISKESNRKDSLSEVRERFNKFITTMEAILKEGQMLKNKNANGAHSTISEAIKAAGSIKVTQQSLENQKANWQRQVRKAQDEVTAIETRSKQLNDDWSQLDRGIAEFREHVKQFNRLLCGDNSIPPDDEVDTKLCPSTCGGAACDPVAKYIGLRTSSLIRRFRATLTDLTSTYGMKIHDGSELDHWIGLIGGCGTSAGCQASVGGRLRSLMEQNLDLQIHLIHTVQDIYSTVRLISKVHIDRKDAEERIINSTIRALGLQDQLMTTYNVTASLVLHIQEFAAKNSNLTQTQFNELITRIETEKINVTTAEVGNLQRELEKRVEELRSKVDLILMETADDRRKASNLLVRANHTRDRALDFADQINQLKKAEEIYEQLSKNQVVTEEDEIRVVDKLSKLKNTVNGLEVELDLFRLEASGQADVARAAKEKADVLLANANVVRKDSLETLQELGNIEISLQLLDEKMNELDRMMSQLDTGGNDGSDDDDERLADPKKLMEEVQKYTANLEKQSFEIKEIGDSLEKMELDSGKLGEEMSSYVNALQKLSEHLSIHTKSYRLCT